MNIVLWILTGLLAAVALLGGTSKTFLSKARLDAMHGSWTGVANAASVKLLGIVELTAAAGLILPAVLGIAPVLVPVTALCWAVLPPDRPERAQRLAVNLPRWTTSASGLRGRRVGEPTAPPAAG